MTPVSQSETKFPLGMVETPRLGQVEGGPVGNEFCFSVTKLKDSVEPLRHSSPSTLTLLGEEGEGH